MSDLGRFKQFLIVIILLGLLVVVYARAAEPRNDDLLTDPTAPLFPTAGMGMDGEGSSGNSASDYLSGSGGYRLSSILIREEDRVAVINNQRLRVGESIGNARVTAIEQGSVTLNVDGDVQTLELYANSIKTLVEGEG